MCTTIALLSAAHNEATDAALRAVRAFGASTTDANGKAFLDAIALRRDADDELQHVIHLTARVSDAKCRLAAAGLRQETTAEDLAALQVAVGHAHTELRAATCCI